MSALGNSRGVTAGPAHGPLETDMNEPMPDSRESDLRDEMFRQRRVSVAKCRVVAEWLLSDVRPDETVLHARQVKVLTDELAEVLYEAAQEFIMESVGRP